MGTGYVGAGSVYWCVLPRGPYLMATGYIGAGSFIFLLHGRLNLHSLSQGRLSITSGGASSGGQRSGRFVQWCR